jgi:hypothetical protein
MKTIKTKNIILLIGILIMFSGCMKDEVVLKDPQKYTRALNLAGPVFNAHFVAQDLLDKLGDNEYVYVDKEGLIWAKADTSYSTSYDKIVKYDSLEYKKIYDLNAIGGKKSTNKIFSYRDTITASVIPDQRFDSLTMQIAKMEIAIKSPTEVSGNYQVTFPEITDANGVILEFDGILGGTDVQSKPLDNGILRFFQDPNTNKSAFEMVTEGSATINGIPSSTDLEISIKIIDFLPEKVWGYFGRQNTFQERDTMDFDFLNDYADMIQFKHVNMTLQIQSYFGSPVSFTIDSVLFSNTTTGDVVHMPDTAIHLRAIDYYNQSKPSIDSLVLDIADEINIAPNRVYYSVGGWVNYFGEHPGQQDFFINDGNADLDSKITIEVPFWFKTKSYGRTDTVDFNIKDMVDSSLIDYINLYFDFTNGFPFDIYSQAYMADSLGNIVDSLFNDGIKQVWKSPVIAPDGRAGEPELTEVDVILDHDKLMELYKKNATQIFIKSRVNTGGLSGSPDVPEFVKLYDDYIIDISLSLDAKSGNINY